MDAETFLNRWSVAPISERADYQNFIRDICTLIGVEPPGLHGSDIAYTFERRVAFRHDDGTSTPGYIDCYKKDRFVLEAKQSGKRMPDGELAPQLLLDLGGARQRRPLPTADGWDKVMRAAKRQAEGYARALDEWPPFLVIVDVGHCIELWSDFSRQGKNYTPFPDRNRFRIFLKDLRDESVRARLKAIWEDPSSLDPAIRSAEVTNEIAQYLALITRSMEARGPQEGRTEKSIWAGRVAMFLMQCIFAMFAEDVGLLPQKGFQRVIEMYRGKAARFHLAARDFFHLMDTSGHSAAIQEDIRKFNGGLFHDKPVVEITEDELELLSKAAGRDWRNVEPAIFGTLLEQALDPKERAELGAHYTPRSYVERLVVPTIIEPLRADWEAAETEAIGLWLEGKNAAAQEVVRAFHQKLCATRVLDPACGTGNFLYVSLKLMKELEGDVLNVLADLGDTQYGLQYDRHTVSPEQFYGLEKNARAVAIAELVVWIGYLQWHFATFGRAMPSEPILKDTGTIRHQDALLVYDKEELLCDEHGRPITRQDPEAVKLHPITGEVIPDPDAKLPVYRYVNPRPAAWPEAEFIVGNPPFTGKGSDMRESLGDGYVEALWASRGQESDSIDLVMYWWDHAADLLTRKGAKLRRFGLITTNSIKQKLNRKIVERYVDSGKIGLVFAIPDHPWYKSPPHKRGSKVHKKAAVRIAMTVAQAGEGRGRLLTLQSQAGLNTDNPTLTFSEIDGKINADLSVVIAHPL